MQEVYTLADLRRWPEATAGVQPPLRLAVIGDPVAHSASPPMHNAALAALGIDARYARLHLRAEELPEAFPLLAKHGFIGINCTIPHKQAALRLVDEADAAAVRAGGVNTVVVQPEGKLKGYSTDGPGFARAIEECFGVALGGLRVAVLGAAGGAGRAVSMQCAEAGCPKLYLQNRTAEKLVPLAEEIAGAFPECGVSIASLGALPGTEIDLFVNCSALGMKAGDPSVLPPDRLLPGHFVYDTIYTAARTPLMRAADEVGARSANGLSMLLHQGVLAFELWFGRKPPLDAMRAALEAAAPR